MFLHNRNISRFNTVDPQDAAAATVAAVVAPALAIFFATRRFKQIRKDN
jgi:hypothetical protein